MQDEMMTKKNNLAIKVLDLANSTLLVKLRMLGMALNKCVFKEYEGTIATDGRFIYYNPDYVLKMYKKDYKLVNRVYLHLVLHNMLLHLFIGPKINDKYWDAATDIAVENIINEFNLASVDTSISMKCVSKINVIKQDVESMTADAIYKYLLINYSEEDIEEIMSMMHYDEHSFWYIRPEDNASGSAQSSLGKSSNGDNDKQSDTPSDAGANGMQDDGGNKNEDASDDISDVQDMLSQQIDAIKEEWKHISRQSLMDMETFSKGIGALGGDFEMNIKEVLRERYDYTSFLKNFAEFHEVMKVNDDEFDYIFYTYGLNLYGNIPLIEPLEYKDDKIVKELAIVIDTSGSTTGEVVEAFIRKTYNILKQKESFTNRYRICIIQADAEIQSADMINNDDELEQYIKHFKLKGCGGTDFVPAFEYVDNMVKKREFMHLGGLIYFTDGQGIFPMHAPKYKSAIVYYEDNYAWNNYNVPSWLIKLELGKEDIVE